MEELYGYGEQEVLDSDIEETVRRVAEDEGFSDFPIQVDIYKRLDIAKNVGTFARDLLDNILEDLDQEHGDPDGNGTESTENMRKASRQLAKVLMEEYSSWACEKTGRIIEYSEEESRKLFSNTKDN